MGRATGNWTIFFTLAALAVVVCCSQLESIDRRAAAELLEYIDLKKSLLRRVRVEVQRLAKTAPELSREEIDTRLKALIKRQAPRLFKQIGATDGLQTYKDSLLQRVIEGSLFSLGQSPQRMLTPLIAGTKLYRIDTQSSSG